MEQIIADMQQQHHRALDSLAAAVDACPENLWNEPEGPCPFWREAYHALFWFHTFLGDSNKRFHPHPFGKDIDPRLFSPVNNTCSRAEFARYLQQTRQYIDEVFDGLTVPELSAAEACEGDEGRTVLCRMLYGLRHVPHHVGKLTAALRNRGIDVDTWR